MDESSPRARELQTLAEQLKVEFNDLGLLDQALTHASAVAEAPDVRGNNESLEFLGDAVLGLAVAQWLYEKVPDQPPGEYTQMRARVVNRNALANVADAMDIAAAIRLGKGEEASEGRSRKGLLADCVEAIIGAVFLDGGWAMAQQFVERVFDEELEGAKSREAAWDFRSRLQNYCQSKRLTLPEFTVINESGPDHRKTFEIEVALRHKVVGCGIGSTKKEAEQNAARAALKHEGQQVD